MGVAGKDCIDTGNARQRQRHIFLERIIVIRVDPGMGQGNDNIGAFVAHPGNPGPGRIQDVTGDQPVLEVELIPGRDLRWQQADQSNAQIMYRTVAIGHAMIEDQERWVKCLVLIRRFPRTRHRISAGDRKGCVRENRLQPIEAKIELVIAQTGRIISQIIHRRDCRMWPGPSTGRLSRHITDRCTLKEIPIVQKQAIRHLRSRLMDQRRGTCQAKRCLATIGIIVERQEV
nr:hypothetical protein [uncultured Roseovarius sp.]